MLTVFVDDLGAGSSDRSINHLNATGFVYLSGMLFINLYKYIFFLKLLVLILCLQLLLLQKKQQDQLIAIQ